ncbi:chitin deacetylase [Podila verticillata]|nr:chitin deacetylase [Podila verticillata]
MLLKSLAVSLLVAVGAIHAQAVIPGYPPLYEVPDVNSREVKRWLKQIDLSGAPKIPLNVGEVPPCPTEPFPDRLLDYLKAEKLKATFFLVGTNVVQRPDIVRRQFAEGHHLASHTWSHKGLTALTNEQIVAEVKWTEKLVRELTGRRLKYVRPPYGDLDNRVRYVLKKLGYTVAVWSGGEFGTNDWMLPNLITEKEIVDTFADSLDAYVAGGRKGGVISLEHDLDVHMVNLAKKLVPLGRARNITVTDVAGCQKDKFPYQRRHDD